MNPRVFTVPLALALAAPLAGLSACDAGQGSGTATGSLFIEDCKEDDDRGTREVPTAFDLGASFFAGEPIEDPGEGDAKLNRLVLRIQRSGARNEYNDSIFFHIDNVFEVARCVRGRQVLQSDGTTQPDYDPSFCHWDADGPARLRVGIEDVVRGFLMPAHTCTRPIIAYAQGCATGNDCSAVPFTEWSSWLEIDRFGEAAQPELPATERDPIERDFIVNFGERIRGSAFFLTLDDAQVLEFMREDFPIGQPRRQIGGTLMGNFDFDLERNRSAQTFP